MVVAIIALSFACFSLGFTIGHFVAVRQWMRK